MFFFSRSHGFGEALRQVMRLAKARSVPIVLGAVLLAAAAFKTHQLTSGPMPENSLFTSRWFLIGLGEFELALGLWLLSGAYPKQARIMALVTFASFGVVSLYQAFSGESSCGCFGKASVSPRHTLLLDSAAVVALWFWHSEGARGISTDKERNVSSHSFRLTASGFIFLMIGIPVAVAMSRYTPAFLTNEGEIVGDNSTVVLEPETWVGKRFPLLKHINIGEQLAKGKWLVMLYHHNCPRCREAITRLRGQARQVQENVALIELSPYEAPQLTASPVLARSWRHGRVKGEGQWFVETPLFIELEDGGVAAPCPARPSLMVADSMSKRR